MLGNRRTHWTGQSVRMIFKTMSATPDDWKILRRRKIMTKESPKKNYDKFYLYKLTGSGYLKNKHNANILNK